MSHLTKEQRYTIAQLHKQHFHYTHIAKIINVNPSTGHRELKRNASPKTGNYNADQAHQLYKKRQSDKPRLRKITANMQEYITDKLKQSHSPEQISGRARLKGIDIVSFQSIYNYLSQDKDKGGKLFQYLRVGKYKSRGAKRPSDEHKPRIKDRDKIVDLKERFGDLEVDTIVSEAHKGTILTINERLTGLCFIRKLPNKDSLTLADIMVEMLRPYKNKIHTITSDNGTEFAQYNFIRKELNIDFYFCDVSAPWQRGANENLNGLIRKYIPKKSNFDKYTDEQIKDIERALNNRPRKRLDYLTPLEKYFSLKII